MKEFKPFSVSVFTFLINYQVTKNIRNVFNKEHSYINSIIEVI